MRRSNRNNSGWSSLPLVPMGNILEHLSLKDVLAASSISRHWRDGLLMYEGRRNTLELHTKELDKSAFLTRMFKKHVRALCVFIDNGSEEEISKFMNRIMPQFYDTLKLKEIIIVGPGCGHHANHVKIDRIHIESLVLKHSRCIQMFGLMNCKWDTSSAVKEDKELHERVEFYSRGLRFDAPSAADSVLSPHTSMMVSSLKHIILDYDLITTESLETLSHLRSFNLLSAMLSNTERAKQTVNWTRAMTHYRNGLSVALNLIYIPPKKMDEVVEHVLVDDLPLTSLKVMFCRTMHNSLVKHVVQRYRASLRELVWADAPHEGPCTRDLHSARSLEHEARNVNPFVLLCWQCTQLSRLVVHGYWLWQYDIIGFARLRKSLAVLEISAVCGRQRNSSKPATEQPSLARLIVADIVDLPDDTFQMPLPVRLVGGPPSPGPGPGAPQGPYGPLRPIPIICGRALAAPRRRLHRRVPQQEVSELDWKPTMWRQLHPALRKRASPAQRAEYVAREVRCALVEMVREVAQN